MESAVSIYFKGWGKYFLGWGTETAAVARGGSGRPIAMRSRRPYVPVGPAMPLPIGNERTGRDDDDALLLHLLA
jgi:hypothetical protein